VSALTIDLSGAVALNGFANRSPGVDQNSGNTSINCYTQIDSIRLQSLFRFDSNQIAEKAREIQLLGSRNNGGLQVWPKTLHAVRELILHATAPNRLFFARGKTLKPQACNKEGCGISCVANNSMRFNVEYHASDYCIPHRNLPGSHHDLVHVSASCRDESLSAGDHGTR